ncbi:uncharacterized protein BDV17DRAFT_290830 [Aspergillus undulatus]|uniref:uncharacterized protein n=1 Tax=Aspergillus undulatus TaxID=1810928 RepID=UPI003CCCAFD6
MVFLRLTVKVYPREQAPPSNTFSFRSFLGDRGDREKDDASRTSSTAAAGKPASFLIVLENSEDVTLGGLAGMIREKWRKLRPGVEPLTIKKLLDDDHEADDLDTDMTVADVFVDKGKARADGLDQRRTVRVIQKPAGGVESPVRFPSVTQDWDAAAEHYEIQRQKKLKQEAESAVDKLGRIEEESQRGSRSPLGFEEWAEYTPNRTHRRDIPVTSVERDEEIPASPSQPAPQSPIHGSSQQANGDSSSAPQEKRMGSEELGDSPKSSRATPPRKKSTPRRGSTHSQGSAKQSDKCDASVADSPGLQLAHEHTHSVSPQKRPAPEAAEPAPTSVDEETQSESESGSESESEEESSEGESDKENKDKDGDTAMRDETTPKKPKSPVTTERRAIAVEVPASGSSVAGQSRKRKNSTDHLSPNKERRLDRTTPPAANRPRQNSEVSPGTPRFSPSGRRLGGTASFSGVARRLSFSERGSEPPSQGLGLGITKSPSKNRSVTVEPSQNTTQLTEVARQSRPIPPSSAPVARRRSLSQNVSTPTNLQTPADKVKNLHSALRKEDSVEKHSARRSVSFVDGDEISITGSQPAPKPTPMDGAKPTKSKAASTAGSEKRRSGGSMVFPPGVSMEKIAQYEREAEAKFERQKNEKAEWEKKIKTAEKDKAKAEYAKLLKAAFATWKSILNDGKALAKATETRLRKEFDQQQAKIKEMEASMSKKSFREQGEPQAFLEPSKSQRSSKNDATAPSKKTPTPAINGDRKSPVRTTSGWNSINSPLNKAKALTPTSLPKPTPKEPTATTVATKTLTTKQSNPASIPSQNSTASDDVELPAMKVQARANATSTKKPTTEKPVDVSSETSETSDTSDDEDEEEEGSSDEASESGSGSESESGSGSDFESENTTKKPSTSKSPAPTPKASQTKTTSPPSAQRTTKHPAPPSQQTASQSQSQSQLKPPQSQSLFWPASQTGTQRLSLKGIKGEIASQSKAQAAAAKTAPQKRNQPRRDMFSPPSSSSEETEESSSESEDESEDEDGSESGSDDGKGKKTGEKNQKRSVSPSSVGDEGDIMSTGQVQKLRTARLGNR